MADTHDVEVAENARKLNRGLILLTLNAQYPSGCTRKLLLLSVLPVYGGKELELDRDLKYLGDSGLLTMQPPPPPGRSGPTYTLTPAGVDLVEGEATHPRVVVMRA